LRSSALHFNYSSILPKVFLVRLKGTAAMRFEFYHAGLESVPKLSVDGTVAESIHFSHWRGNTTAPALKADTSTEIALNLVNSPNYGELTGGVELVTNNHFDTDGVLSVWTVLAGERAFALRDKLIAAAEAGDFCEYSSDEGVRASIVIQGSDIVIPEDKEGSPLARSLSGGSMTDEARSYELVLPEVERVLTHTDDYESLWRDSWERIAAGLESFARGASKVEEQDDAGLSVVMLAPELFGPRGFEPTLHAPPLTAISHHARGQLYLIATPTSGGWSYRADYPYYSWAETIVRPRIERRDFSALMKRLSTLETNGEGRWQLDERELSSAFKFMDETGTQCASHLAPERVVEEVRAGLMKTEAATSIASAVQ
jgi:hypothetical protein